MIILTKLSAGIGSTAGLFPRVSLAIAIPLQAYVMQFLDAHGSLRVWSSVLLLVLAFHCRGIGTATAATLRFGDIDTTVLSGSVDLDSKFTGTVSWGPLASIDVGDVFVDDVGGDVLLVKAGFVSVSFPQPYDPPTGNWSYYATGTTLSDLGARAVVDVVLPDGIQFKRQESDAFYREGKMDIGVRNLDQEARIAGPIVLAGVASRIRVENEPFTLRLVGAFDFSDAGGFVLSGATLEYTFKDEYQVGPGARPSNTNWLADGQLTSIPSLTMQGLSFTATDATAATFAVAFPDDAGVFNADWTLNYASSRVQSGSLNSTAVAFTYRGEVCGGAAADSVILGATTFSIGQDWALLGTPDQNGDTETIAFDAYTIPDIDADGQYYIPGGKTAGVFGIDQFRPESYLLSGRVDIGANPNSFATPTEDAYTRGDGAYAGWTLHKSDLAGQAFSMVLACENAPFDSSSFSKVYLRRGGVSGTLDASDDSVADLPPLNLYGQYETVLTRFNITFLDNHQWQDSAVEGTLTLPFPSDVSFDFRDLEIDPCGSPGGATIDTQENTLVYWNRVFQFRGLEFRDVKDGQGDPVMSSCGTPLRSLWTKSANTIPEVGKALLCDTNFNGDGDILSAVVTGDTDNTLQEWAFSARGVYYTVWDGTQNLNGRTVLLGDQKLPFWGATPVVAIYNIGGLPEVFDGRSYAQSPPVDIDPDRNAFPAGISTIEQYLNDATRRPLVSSTFANIIPLEYRVEYNSVQRRFATASGEEKERDLVVLNINSSVGGITRSDTELRFAASFAIPSINLSSLLEDFANQGIQQLLGPLKTNMEKVNTTLSGNFGEAIRSGMEDLTRPAVTQMVNEIRAAAANADGALSAAELAGIDAIIDARIGTLEGFLKTELSKKTGPIVGRIDQMLGSLEQIESTISNLDPSLVQQVLVALVELAGGDASGVESVFDDVEAARAYIVENLIKEQLRPQLLQLRTEIDNIGSLTEIQDLIDGAEFVAAMNDVRDKVRDTIATIKNNASSVRNLDPEAVNTAVVNAIYNSVFHLAVTQVVQVIFEPIKAQVQNVINGFLDALNNQVKAYLDALGGVLDNAQSTLNDIRGMAAAEMSGYAVFGGESLDRLHIDAEFSMKAPDDFGFRGSLDVERFRNNTNAPVCGTPVGAETLKIKIATYDIPLNFPRSSLRADQIALMLRINQNAQDAWYLSDVGGLLETSGALNFEAVKIVSPSFAAGVGENETYIAFAGSIVFNKVSMRGGIFLGKTCNGVEILKTIDPEVEGTFTQDEITGIYAFGEAAIPIVDYGCFLRVGATAGAGFWYFTEGPSYGGKLTAGVYGEGVCLISVRGKIVLMGGKEADGYFFKGLGWVAGGLGWCEPEAWFLVDDVWADKWCLTCVLWLQATYRGGWSVDTNAECRR